MTAFTQNQVREIRTAALAALKKVGEEHGCAFAWDRITFDRNGEMRGKLVVVNTESTPKTPEDTTSDSVDMVHLKNHRPHLVNRLAHLRGTQYKIIGFRPNARKNNILIQGPKGGVWITPEGSLNLM